MLCILIVRRPVQDVRQLPFFLSERVALIMTRFERCVQATIAKFLLLVKSNIVAPHLEFS